MMREMTNKTILVTGGSGFIGTNLVAALEALGHDIVNLDIKPPLDPKQRRFWRACDLLEEERIRAVLGDCQPSAIVHLAARTDTDGDELEYYAANHRGTANLLAAARDLVPGLDRLVLTSTQFVVGPGAPPANDLDFRPHTVYGQSKVLTEKLLRESDPAYTWTIVRPTNVWGPWHPRYPNEFWRIVKRGLYFHPGDMRVMRTYGYVGNVVDQIINILAARRELVDKAVFYLGDAPIPLLDWVNAFCRELTGRPARIVPTGVVRVTALAGDVAKAVGLPAPIFSSRFRSMTQNYVTPMEPTFAAFGSPPIPMQEGVSQTVRWLRTQDSFWN